MMQPFAKMIGSLAEFVFANNLEEFNTKCLQHRAHQWRINERKK